MCLLIFAHQTSTRYPLVIAANRDEFHARPTTASQFWTDHPVLLAGKDLDQGGTWMGVTRDGRFAAITNYRDPSRTAVAPRSRGELPLDYLAGQCDPQAYLQGVAAQATEYAGFNLLLGDRDHLWYFTNSLPQAERAPLCLQPGIYGLSNARLDTLWPKVAIGKTRMKNLLDKEPPTHDALASVVSDQRLADLHTLRPHGMETGMDQLLSAQFIVTGLYGTRSSTTLWTDSTGLASWRELSFNELGEIREVREFEFALI
ncbi:MAG: hypothetical protein DRR04_06045 [Gammaproteobacteria bacterium]|nr:MAG: hypothetical protein DRQ98_02470 [Gammaproteobacteria bacterium]RLA60305.1 MAG: hypothetical protein DRR04_06045 [Gammaproteobacteria bacterium]